jgi:nucleotide-binding universal stress UspA family protein
MGKAFTSRENFEMNLLLATDGSCYARAAASFLRSHLDPSAPVRIEIVAVTEPPDEASSPSAFHRLSEDRARGPARAHEWLHLTQEELGPALVPVRSRILEGTPEDVLVRAAREYDLVVAGVKGCGAAPFFELGRVASGLLRDSDSSVLLVRDRRPVGSNGHASGRVDGRAPTLEDVDGAPGLKVMIPVALAGEEVPAGWPLLQSFALSRASVEVVAVFDRALRSHGAGGGAHPGSNNGTGDARQRARRWLNSTASRLLVPSGRPRCALLEGRPGAEIERRAFQTGTDLIVVGARRGHLSGSGPLGSTARELAWSAPCSILTVRGRQYTPTSAPSTAADASAHLM